MRITSVSPNGIIRKNIERPVTQPCLQPSFSGGGVEMIDALPIIIPAVVTLTAIGVMVSSGRSVNKKGKNTYPPGSEVTWDYGDVAEIKRRKREKENTQRIKNAPADEISELQTGGYMFEAQQGKMSYDDALSAASGANYANKLASEKRKRRSR